MMRAVVAEYVEKKERSQQNEMQNKLNTISEKYVDYYYFVTNYE